MSAPVALSTLFELPLDQFGTATGGTEEQQLTAAALQQLDLGAAEAGPDATPAAPPAPSGPTCIACGIGVGGAAGFASAEEQRRHFSLVGATLLGEEAQCIGIAILPPVACLVTELHPLLLNIAPTRPAAASAHPTGLAPLQCEAAGGGAAPRQRSRL